jgi:4-amino-4-deoxy-L-arabinose transferase-like glycosyltransferase
VARLPPRAMEEVSLQTSDPSGSPDPAPAAVLRSFVARRPRLCAAAVLALLACNLLLGLASSKVNDFEEARYGVSAYEMQQHRAFVVPTYAGQKELWALKPPLGYWLMALSFALFGGSALALRLPSALCALAATAATMWWARRWFDLRLALLAGLIVATTFGFLSHHGARSGDFDAGLTLVLTLIAVQLPKLGDAPWRVVALGALFACGFLLKSFAIVPMILVVCVYMVWTGGWRRLRLGACLAGLGLFALIVGAWAVARWRADASPDFLLRMVREDVVGRSTSIVDKSTSSPIGYATALFDRFAPWPPLMIAAVLLALRAGMTPRLRRSGVQPLLILWVAIPLVFISLVRTQHHWYLDPIYPALAMLAAGSALFLVDRAPSRGRIAALAGLVVLPLALCEARLLTRVLTKDRMPDDQLFLSALAPGAAGGCREIRSTCRLAYSERFILEVMDGLAVVEPGAVPSAAAGGAARPACLLVGKRSWRLPPAPAADRLPPRGTLVAENASYALYRLAAPAPRQTAGARSLTVPAVYLGAAPAPGRSAVLSAPRMARAATSLPRRE